MHAAGRCDPGAGNVGAADGPRRLASLFAVFVVMLVSGEVQFQTQAEAQDRLGVPTPEQYLKSAGPDAKIVPSGALKVAGYSPRCGNRPTVLDNALDDYGAAYPGFVILNPKRMSRLPSAVQLWIHAHECAHQFRGPDEVVADCFAVQRGRRRGWLSPAGIEEICAFISPAEGTWTHFSGAKRCKIMRKCFRDRKIH